MLQERQHKCRVVRDSIIRPISVLLSRKKPQTLCQHPLVAKAPGCLRGCIFHVSVDIHNPQPAVVPSSVTPAVSVSCAHVLAAASRGATQLHPWHALFPARYRESGIPVESLRMHVSPPLPARSRRGGSGRNRHRGIAPDTLRAAPRCNRR